MIKKTRAIITGGKGFFGEHLIKNLSSMGYDCHTFDRVDGQDVTDRKLVLNPVRGNDVIFHLAGVLGTHELNERAYEATIINVLGALNVFDAARKHKARVILAAKPNPWLNAYTITKEASEKFALMYAQIYGCDFRAGRFYSLYGPGQKTKEHGIQKAVPTFIMQALNNEPVTIFGTGNQTADFIHVSDAAEAFARLGHTENLHGEIIDIGTGRETEINFLAEMIIRLVGSNSKIVHIPMRTGEPLNARVVADTTKMATLLHFTPQVSLEDGIKETIEWYKFNIFMQQPFISVPV
jgi:UDP-glucose 4-epimerase